MVIINFLAFWIFYFGGYGAGVAFRLEMTCFLLISSFVSFYKTRSSSSLFRHFLVFDPLFVIGYCSMAKRAATIRNAPKYIYRAKKQHCNSPSCTVHHKLAYNSIGSLERVVIALE